MDDFERLFALTALVSDPEAAKKNAEALQEINRARAENTKKFKEVKAAEIALNEARQELEEERKNLRKEKDDLKSAHADLEKERRAARDEKAAALEDARKIRTEIADLESQYKKREQALKNGLAKIEADIAKTGERKQQAEAELEKIRKLINA